MKKLAPVLAAAGAVAAVAVAAAVAAGSALAAPSHPAAKAAGTTPHVTALKNGLAFDTRKLGAKAGTVTITLKNLSALKHDLVIESGEKILAKTPLLAMDRTGSLTVKLAKGTYDFVCDVPGHEDAGMKGTLTVK